MSTSPSADTTQTASPRIPDGIPGHVATGSAPLPFLLLEGQPGSGRSRVAAELSGDDRLGTTYWMDLGDGSADQYASVPGARPYVVVDHDGTYPDVYELIKKLWAEADRARLAEERPVLLVLDGGTDLYNALQSWTNGRARRAAAGRKALTVDPDGAVKVDGSLWTVTNDRWRDLLELLKTFPGVVVFIANGDEKTEEGGETRWVVWSDRALPHVARVHVRLFNDGREPLLVKARTATGDMPAMPAPGPNLLGRLIFDQLGFDPATAVPLTLNHLRGGQLMPHEVFEDELLVAAAIEREIDDMRTRDDLARVYAKCVQKTESGVLSRPTSQRLAQRYTSRKERIEQRLRQQIAAAETGTAQPAEAIA